jgi:enoyl-CoA hydratase/carnithine racemase
MKPRDYISFEVREQVAFLGLNRAEKCNAIHEEFAKQLTDAISSANREARVCIIFGHGRHFCSGLDLNWMKERLAAPANSAALPGRSLGSRRPMEAIARSAIPYISAMHGATIGLGLELAAATHVRVADETASFSLPEARRGIFLGGGGAANISRLIGVARMQDMMLTGRVYSASEALGINLVQYVVPVGEALAKAHELANAMKENSSFSNYAILQGLPRIFDMPVDDGIFWEGVLARTSVGSDTLSRLSEFLDKPKDLER